jgi:hypothetical protein
MVIFEPFTDALKTGKNVEVCVAFDLTSTEVNLTFFLDAPHVL